MYLAIKEIKREKLRYGMIIAMIALISWLIFILTGLAQVGKPKHCGNRQLEFQINRIEQGRRRKPASIFDHI